MTWNFMGFSLALSRSKRTKKTQRIPPRAWHLRVSLKHKFPYYPHLPYYFPDKL